MRWKLAAVVLWAGLCSAEIVDLAGPAYDPPDCPSWAKEVKPAWVMEHVGYNGTPAVWRPAKKVLGSPVRGVDRYQANQFVYHNAATAAYLEKEYTPLKVDYKAGTLLDYEKIAATHTKGAGTDLEKALALLTNAMPAALRHPGMPPLGAPVGPGRNLDDAALLASGSGWCNEQARVFIRLCQVSGIPARMIHLFGQNHTIAEFFADGGWVMADASSFFAARGADGRWLSAAACHDRGPGQRAYAQAKAKRMTELAAMTDRELGFTDAAQAAAWRASSVIDVDELAVREVGFGVMNYPLPR